MENKKSVSVFVFVIFIIIAIAVGFFAGNWWGKNQGITEATQELQPLIDTVFPEPPAYIGNLTGTIKEISGATIAIEINSLDDYLPHLDGSPIKTETRLVVTTPTTNIISIDTRTGNSKKISLQDLKMGESISVSSMENIRDVKKFDATEVRVVR